MTGHVPATSWVRSGLVVRASAIDGIGVFTTDPIAPDEIVIRWGGQVFSKEQVEGGVARRHTIVAISETQYLAIPHDADPTTDDFMNHSCDPNIWMADAITLVARRAIRAGEELTADYAIWLNNPEYVMNKTCNCGAPTCRRRITGRDWMDPDVQASNRGHFSPFLNARIADLSNAADAASSNGGTSR